VNSSPFLIYFRWGLSMEHSWSD